MAARASWPNLRRMINIAYSFKLGYSAAGVTLILGRHEMDMLDAMRAFVRVVETGSFSAVAPRRASGVFSTAIPR